MIGHKYNLSELLEDLQADSIKHTHTEFCQGRVTRWGLAWTYQKHDIYKLGKWQITHILPDYAEQKDGYESMYLYMYLTYKWGIK